MSSGRCSRPCRRRARTTRRLRRFRARVGVTSSGSARLHGSAALAALGLLAALAVRRARARDPGRAVRRARRHRPAAGAAAGGAGLPWSWSGTAPSRATRSPPMLSLRSAHALDRLELVLVLPDGLESAEDENPAAVTLRPDEEREVELTIRCARWGSHRARRAASAGERPVRTRRDRVARRPARAPARLPATRARALDAQADQDAGLSRGTRSRARKATGSSSPTPAHSCPATGSARSTGVRARVARR